MQKQCLPQPVWYPAAQVTSRGQCHLLKELAIEVITFWKRVCILSCEKRFSEVKSNFGGSMKHQIISAFCGSSSKSFSMSEEHKVVRKARLTRLGCAPPCATGNECTAHLLVSLRKRFVCVLNTFIFLKGVLNVYPY